MIFKNAKDTPINQASGNLPQMGHVLRGWFRQLTFTRIVKSVVNFQNVEAKTDYPFQGVWQPMSARQLSMKPEGQRAWKWFTVHAEPSLVLNPDEVITYQGEQYRVNGQWLWPEYGYVEYHLCQDYTGSGP